MQGWSDAATAGSLSPERTAAAVCCPDMRASGPEGAKVTRKLKKQIASWGFAEITESVTPRVKADSSLLRLSLHLLLRPEPERVTQSSLGPLIELCFWFLCDFPAPAPERDAS